MSRIELDLSHSYHARPERSSDYALLPLKICFEDGGAYALLGPSGCGKTTMLNIISGLIAPSSGHVRFDGKAVTHLSPQSRNIAQVFQFPVVYDTLSVAQNLAFPLINRNFDKKFIDQRVHEIASILELTEHLKERAVGLSADVKQKISLGRGLVRPDVSAILFDEPLTVIDPHLKWQLRRKLKQIHQELKLTLIYVTHDQVEALTFAEQTIVMSQGSVVQKGSATDLFERPEHTFVGYFIGSPGMNFLQVQRSEGQLFIDGWERPLYTEQRIPEGPLKLGIRPEYITTANAQEVGAVQCRVDNIQNLGTHWILSCSLGSQLLKAKIFVSLPGLKVGDLVYLKLLNRHTCFYHNEVLVA